MNLTHPIPRPVSGGLILSYKCNAECLHCMYACSPQWAADWISASDLERILTQLAGSIEPAPYGPETIGLNHGLHFTGGEPFLNFELLVKAVEMAEELGIPSTFIETNCFWCRDDGETREKLRFLKETGLKGILISVNPFYLEYVPFERTKRALRISLDVFGRNVAVYQWEYYKRFKEWGITDRLPLTEYLKYEGIEDLFRHVEFFIMGRAPYALRDRFQGVYSRYPASAFVSQLCRPPFLRNWHNHFDNYGNYSKRIKKVVITSGRKAISTSMKSGDYFVAALLVMTLFHLRLLYIPGYCGGITLGDCRDLGALLQKNIDAETYPILDFLIRADMEGLLTFAGNFSYREAANGYFSKCHLCVDVRKQLALQGDFAELRPKTFYTHLD